MLFCEINQELTRSLRFPYLHRANYNYQHWNISPPHSVFMKSFCALDSTSICNNADRHLSLVAVHISSAYLAQLACDYTNIPRHIRASKLKPRKKLSDYKVRSTFWLITDYSTPMMHLNIWQTVLFSYHTHAEPHAESSSSVIPTRNVSHRPPRAAVCTVCSVCH